MSSLTLPHKLNNLYPLKVIKTLEDYNAALASMEAVFKVNEKNHPHSTLLMSKIVL